MSNLLFYKKLMQNPKAVSQREGVARALKKLEKNKKVVVLSAGLEESTRVLEFKKSCPERFIEVGVAEQNLSGVSAGLAMAGLIPIATSFGVFSPGRNWEQIRVSICYQNLHAIFLGSHAGVSVGEDGATHQALEDLALTCVLPNMTVLAPADAVELEKAILDAVRYKGPVYIRFHRHDLPLITSNSPFEIGKGKVLIKGKDVSIFATGSMVHEALKAAIELEKEGVEAEVINMPTIKPIDQKLIISSVKKTKAALTAEEHQIFGGLGSAISQVLSKNYPIPVEFVGVSDQFGESGSTDELLKKYHLTAKDIQEKSKKVIARKL